MNDLDKSLIIDGVDRQPYDTRLDSSDIQDRGCVNLYLSVISLPQS
jgi:hypothetical protein